jgi:BirA family transcriptional regulator, biotin operon repressor / biotin---[acetyl-CoA-carboxylase] ligase
MEFTQAILSTALAPRTVRFLPQVGSTNDLALEWLQQDAATGSMVITDEQITGRGRLGRQWYSPPGSALFVSMILRPSAEFHPQMTMLAAVAISDMLRKFGASDVAIKWPNDVLLHGRKVAGILPEAVWQNGQLQGVVLGMGINVRIDFGDTELAEKAISIEPALGHPVDRLELLVTLVDRLDSWYAAMGDALFSAWKNRLHTLGTTVSIQTAQGVVHGLAEDVDTDGALWVRLADNRLERILVGDVSRG